VARARHLLAGLLSLPGDPAARWLAEVLHVNRAELHVLVEASLDGRWRRSRS
jgi:hypothetical protein